MFGAVKLTRSTIGDSLAHGMTELKAIMYAAVPEVIRTGELVSYVEDWDGRSYDSAILAKPVEVKEGHLKGEYYVGAIVHLHDEGVNKYYTHDATAKKAPASMQQSTEQLHCPTHLM